MHTLNSMMSYHAKALENWSKLDKRIATSEKEKVTREKIDEILKPLRENLDE